MRVLPFFFLLAAACRPPIAPSGRFLEPVFQDTAYQLTGIAVTGSGRKFTNYPRWGDRYRNALVEITGPNTVRPFPDSVWNSWRPGEDGSHKWVCVQAVYIDDQGKMWVVDPASPHQKGVWENAQKLVEIDLDSNKVVAVYPLAGTTDNQSYINDVRVDTRKRIAYLTNSSEGGIVVVDLHSGQSRQLLQGHFSVHADPHYVFLLNGDTARKKGALFQSHSDGIALSPDRAFLYYKPLTDPYLYRIRTTDLLDRQLDAFSLQSRVQKLGKFTTTDGMIFDHEGNLYLGDLEKSALMKIDTAFRMTTLVRDTDLLIWPDSFSIPGDGYLYVSCSQIQKGPDFNNGRDKRTRPYGIFRVKLN